MLGRILDSLAHDEQDDGRADGLVTDQSARLPGAVHHALLINHRGTLVRTAVPPRRGVAGHALHDPRDVECGRPDDRLRIVPPLLSFVKWLGLRVNAVPSGWTTAPGNPSPVVPGLRTARGLPVVVALGADPTGRGGAVQRGVRPRRWHHWVETLRIRADDPRGLYALELSGRGVGGIPTGGSRHCRPGSGSSRERSTSARPGSGARPRAPSPSATTSARRCRSTSRPRSRTTRSPGRPCTAGSSTARNAASL